MRFLSSCRERRSGPALCGTGRRGVQPWALSPTVPAALTTWINDRTYPDLFFEAFGTSDVTPAKIALAIATYERTLYSDQTPLDQVNAGIGQLTPAEQRGRTVFTAPGN